MNFFCGYSIQHFGTQSHLRVLQPKLGRFEYLGRSSAAHLRVFAIVQRTYLLSIYTYYIICKYLCRRATNQFHPISTLLSELYDIPSFLNKRPSRRQARETGHHTHSACGICLLLNRMQCLEMHGGLLTSRKVHQATKRP